ncbi:DUF5518 domain-containing protein [Halomarina rubra]|uniref:DUF5518 domain-containing protein n=1 Tax=Halomarina rubra TaxID=2071873 RepID=A0ABD6APN3_9EURY|nr:DUF5518 domain-containing protein [Halomarina rubra]
MVNWYAVVVGFAVEVVLGIVGFVLPGIGQLFAAVVGGFVAGYIAGGSLGNGAWHGLLAGALGGLVIALLVGVFGTAILTLLGGPGGAVLGVTGTALAVVFWLLVSVPSAVGGLLGAAVA